MVICLELGADLHMAQLMPLPLTVSCFSKIQIGFTFLVYRLTHHSSGKRAVKWVCVCATKDDYTSSHSTVVYNYYSATIGYCCSCCVPLIWAAAVTAADHSNYSTVGCGCATKPTREACLRYDTRCYFDVRSKADMSRLDLQHGNDN